MASRVGQRHPITGPIPGRRKALWAIAIAPFVLAGGGITWFGSWRARRVASVAVAARRESRPTTEPALYTGKARRAHGVAREIPEVLGQLRCYCRCEGIGHVSLLSCYTDGHAAT